MSRSKYGWGILRLKTLVRQAKFRFYQSFTKIKLGNLKQKKMRQNWFHQYDEVENYKESYVKNSDSIAFTFNNAGLKKPLKFNIKHEDAFSLCRWKVYY